MSSVEGRAILAMGQDFQDDSQAESREFNGQSPTLWQGDPLLDVQARKVASILDSCNSGDLETLVGLATSEHGLVEDDVRKIAWPVLLGCGKNNVDSLDTHEDWREMSRHRDEDQVKLDVNRSFIYYPESLYAIVRLLHFQLMGCIERHV